MEEGVDMEGSTKQEQLTPSLEGSQAVDTPLPEAAPSTQEPAAPSSQGQCCNSLWHVYHRLATF
jgi:hypothetical protein